MMRRKIARLVTSFRIGIIAIVLAITCSLFVLSMMDLFLPAWVAIVISIILFSAVYIVDELACYYYPVTLDLNPDNNYFFALSDFQMKIKGNKVHFSRRGVKGELTKNCCLRVSEDGQVRELEIFTSKTYENSKLDTNLRGRIHINIDKSKYCDLACGFIVIDGKRYVAPLDIIEELTTAIGAEINLNSDQSFEQLTLGWMTDLHEFNYR